MQIEYALTAVAAGATSLGIKATNGVVLATEKKLRSTLVDETTVRKISMLTPNIGVAYSGMGPDSRLLVRRARKQAQVRALAIRTAGVATPIPACAFAEGRLGPAQAYYRVYKEHIPVAQLCRETAAVMQEFTRARPAATCSSYRRGGISDCHIDILLVRCSYIKCQVLSARYIIVPSLQLQRRSACMACQDV